MKQEACSVACLPQESVLVRDVRHLPVYLQEQTAANPEVYDYHVEVITGDSDVIKEQRNHADD